MRIILTFFISSLLFASFYFTYGAVDYYKLYDSNNLKNYIGKIDSEIDYPGLIKGLYYYDNELKSFRPPSIRLFIRSYYFSVVTMTTLGANDMVVRTNSSLCYLIIIFHVLFGYFLLGALITRLSIVFNSGGPTSSIHNSNRVSRL